ncbi:cell division cycle-associated protein 2 isoform X3 [Cheilinus undulatus]|uniref:cell division cycle-associated protein 2 isoform X3 n=1 Tax=Cheilinus undulatus TaxID=241271 RepID=UPI001BD5A42B|nr:cell division cycle-associated protein 2 isoform X3 [Cheilinus undulatus]
MMAAVDVNAAGTEEDQKEEMLTPSTDALSEITNGNSAPLNFSELTPHQFGISVQSFTPASLSNRKDRSRLAQIKARRRSSVGVRGSPETNSLIRFMAQQRMKTPPNLKTPELVRSSPFLPRVASTLKQKMATFQNLMDVEESEGCDPTPKQDSNTGGCIKTRDYLSDGNRRDGEKENHPPMVTPNKRRRLGPLESCEVEIREASAPILHFSLKEREEEEKQETQVVTEGPLTDSGTEEEREALCVSPALHVNAGLQPGSDAKTQQDVIFELQSPCHPPPDDPAVASPARPASSLRISSLPSLLEMKPTGEGDSSAKSIIKKKKRVHFGGPLSPEFFDKNLPPSTPLQKGGTPARAQTPGGSLQLRSLLKTPQGCESQTQRAQPDLSSPTVFGASPTLAIPRNRRTPTVGDDSEDNDGKIVFPSMDEIDSAVINDTEGSWDIQPMNLDNAFHEECLPQILTESDLSTASQLGASDEPSSLPEEQQLEADVQAIESKSRKRKQSGPKCESTNEAPARSRSRKRKPEESEPVKRSTRTAAKSASGKMKVNSTSARRWNKDVDRSLYGSRAYASKNPTLSPITERLSFISQSPAAQQTPATATNDETNIKPDLADETQATSDLTVTNTLEVPSEDSLTSLNSSKVSTTRRGRRLSGTKVRGKGIKKINVRAAEEILLTEETTNQAGGLTEEHCEDQTTTSTEASGEETPLNHTAHDQGAETEPDTQNAADSERNLECFDAPTSNCQPLTEESLITLSPPSEITQRKYNRGRRSSLYKSAPTEQENQAKEPPVSHDIQESVKGDQAANQEENNKPSSESQEEGEVVKLDLAPWQVEFNFEDVFKPVASRGQRSVRRSLRNRNTSNSEGLAWLPWTSPESSKETRRRTRGRRLSAALPVQCAVSEEEVPNGES